MTLDEYFKGRESSRQLFDRLQEVIEPIGRAEIRVTKSQIAIHHHKTFAWAWIPGKYLRGKSALLVLTLSFRHKDPSPRWKSIVEAAPGRFTHHLELWSVETLMTKSMVGSSRPGWRQHKLGFAKLPCDDNCTASQISKTSSLVLSYNPGAMIARWLPYALVCSLFLATADFFVKLASNKISASMGMFIYGATTFVFGFAWVSYLKITGQPLLITKTGLLYALAVGVAFSLVTALLYLTFARVSVSLGSPTIRLLGIVIASLFGILLLHEPFTWRYALGVLLAIAGVILIVLR